MSLADVLPQQVSADTLYEAFVEWAAERGLALYPHQWKASRAPVSKAAYVTPRGPMRWQRD